MNFDANEKAAIVAAWKQLAAEPPPFNPRPVGSLTFLVAGALLLLLPQLSKWTGWKLPEPIGQAVFIGLLVILAAGFFCGVFLGSGVVGRVQARAEASLEWLASHPGDADADARRRHTVSLIANTMASDGPTSSHTIDIAASKQKLGANLQYVVAVERVLVLEKLSYAHFGEQ
jgi:hypothetical protein